MKKLSNLLAVIFVLSFAFPVNAGGTLTANKVTKVAFQTGGFFLYANGWSNPNECSQSSAIVLKSTDSNYDKAYSLLLAAYMSGKKISGYSDGCVEHDGQTFNAIRGFKYLIVE